MLQWKESYCGLDHYKAEPPDRTRCAAENMSPRGLDMGRQCKNKARYDPDEEGRPTTCGVHRIRVHLEDPYLDPNKYEMGRVACGLVDSYLQGSGNIKEVTCARCRNSYIGRLKLIGG